MSSRRKRQADAALLLPGLDLQPPAPEPTKRRRGKKGVSVQVAEPPIPAALMIRPEGYAPDPPPELMGERRIILDAETTGLQWWNGDRPVGWAWYLPESGRRGYLSFAHEGGGNSTTPEQALEWARRELRGIHIDNVNTKYDAHISREWGADWVEQGCTLGDVAHRAALLDDNRFRFNLDQLAADFLGPDRGKLTLPVSKSRMREIPAWVAASYAIEDVTLVNDLVNITQPAIEEQDLEEVLALEEDVLPVVVEIERNGVYLDMSLLEQWCTSAAQEYEEAVLRVRAETGVNFTTPDSNKELQLIFAARGIEIQDWSESGKPSFTGDVMKRVGANDPVIALVNYAGQLADLRSKYLDKYRASVRADGWMRYNLHQLRVGRDEQDKKGTISGRFSAAGDTKMEPDGFGAGGFNIQQVVSPKKQKDHDWCTKYLIRNLFKPQHGQWLAVDAAQVEYRIFAHFANAPDIMARYAENPRMSYHEVVQAMLQAVKPDIKYKHTKICNFCKLYGAGLIKFAWTLGLISDQQLKDLNTKYAPGKWQKAPRGERERQMSAEPLLIEAHSVYSTYDKQIPAAKRVLRLASDTARDRGYVRTILGRRARFPNRERLHSALNRIIQGTAADINKRVLVEVYKLRRELGLTLRATVHDEVDADIMDDGMMPRILDVFNHQYIPLRVPILWDADIGPSWGEAKKKA